MNTPEQIIDEKVNELEELCKKNNSIVLTVIGSLKGGNITLTGNCNEAGLLRLANIATFEIMERILKEKGTHL